MPEALPDPLRAEGVLFDLDGVLTPTAEVHTVSYTHLTLPTKA